MKIKVFQFNGCTKCFNETLLMEEKAERIAEPETWEPEKIDVAVLTGYLLTEDSSTLEKIIGNADKTIAYGTCATRGGPFGLSFQKGRAFVIPSRKHLDIVDIDGCLGEIEELESWIAGNVPESSPLCNTCERKSSCDYLEDVYRQIDPTSDEESCFNDLGLLCNGYVAKSCKEMKIEDTTKMLISKKR